jgi:phosphohistidine phosphatase
MPIVSLLRHAKSNWDDPVERDFDRPLNGRGHRAARRMGDWLKESGLRFDRVLASPALRVRQTVEGVEAGLGERLRPGFDKRIYMASAAALFDIMRETPAGTAHLLLIGHNPGLEDLLLLAAAADGSPLRVEAERKYPTATFASLDFGDRDWAGFGEGGAALVRFVRPRDLDPTLGPDD